jgi:hypothetical protein
MTRSIRHPFAGLLVVLALGAAAGTRADVLIQETFEGLTTGSPLTGQGSPAWGTFLNKSGEVASGTGANTTTIVATPAGSTDNTGNVKTYGNFGLSGSDRIALEFVIRAGNTGADIASLSLGNQATGANPGPFVGAAFGRFELREDSWGTQHPAKKPDNSNFQPVPGTWYRVFSEWDLGTKTGSFLVKDLSGTDPNVSDTGFQQLFFNAAQTQSTASVGALANLAGWEQARIRLGGNGGVGDIDSLRVSTLKTLADYQFETNFDLSSSDTEPFSTASNFGKGSGINWSSSALGTPPRSAFLAGSTLTAATEQDAIAASDYLSFSITPEPGFGLHLAALTFDFQRDDTSSVANYSLYADEDPGPGGDNFSTQIAAGTFGSTVGVSNANLFTYSAVLSDTSFLQGITQPTTFRLYLYGAGAHTGGLTGNARIDSVLLTGQVVPEPSTLVLLVVGGLGFVVTRRRLRRRG